MDNKPKTTKKVTVKVTYKQFFFIYIPYNFIIIIIINENFQNS